MKHMKEVGIRALKQNASQVVAEAAAGEVVIVTDRGRPVVQISPVPKSRLQQLFEAGLARPPKRNLADLGPPLPGPSLSEELKKMREEERY
jgi:prevent-host-death family protein